MNLSEVLCRCTNNVVSRDSFFCIPALALLYVYRVYQYLFFLTDFSLKWIKFLSISCLDCKFCFPCVHSFCLTAVEWQYDFFFLYRLICHLLNSHFVCVLSLPLPFVIIKTLQVSSVLTAKISKCMDSVNSTEIYANFSQSWPLEFHEDSGRTPNVDCRTGREEAASRRAVPCR
jgi:hypothetical protein